SNATTGCGTISTDFTGALPITSHSFAKTTGNFRFAGTFPGAKTAQGTVRWVFTGGFNCDTGDISWDASVPNSPPVLDPIGNKSVYEGQLLSFVLNATDGDGDPLTYSASNLPSGATFDAGTRQFSWTP